MANNNKIKSILREVLKEIQPDEDYEKEIFARLNTIIKKINSGQKNIKAVLGGSGAKGTWLKTFDADIFVLFDYKKYRDKSSELSEILEKILKKKFSKIIRLHGSRDYFQIKEGKFTFEIVPILNIKKAEQAKNITDVSPLHSGWVGKHKKLVNDMKLTKQFCQSQNVYGAESYIRGFSGYVCEILAVHYGSFQNLLKNAAKWPDKVVVDVQKYYKGKDVFKIMNVSKLESPLIVIDPVQKDRNAAAALSMEKFEAFRKASSQFLKNPSMKFFAKKELSREFEGLKRDKCKMFEIRVSPLPGKIDVVGSKLLKSQEFLLNNLIQNGFKILRSGWEWDKKNDAVFYFLIDKKPLTLEIKVEGPPLKIKHHAERFRKLHKKTFEKSGKLWAISRRKFILPEELVKSLLKNPFVAERIKSSKIISK